MDSLVEYVAIYANILVRSKELDELRERLGKLRECLEKSEKALYRDAGSTEAEARQLSLADSHT
jgi:hypothetical protein